MNIAKIICYHSCKKLFDSISKLNKRGENFTPLYLKSRNLIGASLGGVVYNIFCYQVAVCFNNNQDDMYTLLTSLATNNNVNEMKKLIDKGVDVNGRHPLGWTAIHAAAARECFAAVEYLLKNGADVNSLDEYPGTVRLGSRRHMHIVEIANHRYSEFGDNFNVASDFTGFTPLHYAVFNQNKNIIRLLIDYGADITIKNSQGYTPYDLALTEDIRVFCEDEFKKAVENKKKKEKEERKKNPIEKRLKEFIVGQEDAINTVSAAVRRREAGWIRGDKPFVFLFLGSSGVGKTELAKQLSHYLYKNNKKAFIRIDMSEYQQPHEVSKFIGSPPGYVGYEQGGQLTNKLKDCPKSVVLFDEIEKAHPDIITIMLQLFDEGRLTDGMGNTIECPNAIFVMTSNLASEEIAKYATKLRLQKKDLNESVSVSKQFKQNVMYPILKKHFQRDEFLGRITDMIYFLPFTKNELSKLVEIELKFWASQAESNHRIKLTWDHDVLNVLSDGYDIHYGARSLKHEVEKKIIDKLATLHEEGKIENDSSTHITVNYGTKESPLDTPELLFNTKKSSWFNI